MNRDKCKEIFNRISPKPPTQDELCDKASHHCYDLIYPKLFEPYYNKKINFLEIGVYRGGSMLLWKEIFPESKLVGVDWNFNNLKVDLNDVKLIKSSQTNSKLPILLENEMFDIILDDASHKAEDQIKTFNILLPQLKEEGIYIIEDVYPEHLESKKYPEHFLSKFEMIDYSEKFGRGDDRLLIFRKSI